MNNYLLAAGITMGFVGGFATGVRFVRRMAKKRLDVAIPIMAKAIADTFVKAQTEGLTSEQMISDLKEDLKFLEIIISES